MKDFTVPIAAIGAAVTLTLKDYIGLTIGFLTITYLVFKNVSAAVKARHEWKHRNDEERKRKHAIHQRKLEETDL